MSDENHYLDFIKFLQIDQTSEATARAALAASNKFYRSFKIPKRRGGFREIKSPYPSLELIQRKIFSNVLSSFEAHPAAHAFVKKTCALDHAKKHLNGKELLTLDIKDFFPSITKQMIFEVLCKKGITNHFSLYTSILCTLDGTLPQGACTSPLLSNLFFFPLDERLHRLAKSLNLVYSRYADDLAFSGEKIPRNLQKIIEEILLSKGLNLNHTKTQLKINSAKKIITGVSIATGIPKAPKEFKRSLRAQIFVLEKNVENIYKINNFDPLVYERTLGKLNYLLHIEPDNSYAASKKIILSNLHQKFLALSNSWEDMI